MIENKGFTLIEVIIVILISTMIMSGIFKMLNMNFDFYKENLQSIKLNSKLEKINMRLNKDFKKTIDVGEWGVKFDGEDDYIEIPDNPKLDLKQNFTISFWIKTDWSPSDYSTVLLTKGNYKEGYWFEYYHDGSVSFHLSYFNGNHKSVSINNINDNQWHNITGTFDGNIQKIYLDGQLKEEYNSSATTIKVNNYPLTLAKKFNDSGYGKHFANVKFKNLNIWNKTLSQSKIKNNIQNNFLKTENNLVALYKFNNSNNLIKLIDYSKNNLKGNIIGAEYKQVNNEKLILLQDITNDSNIDREIKYYIENNILYRKINNIKKQIITNIKEFNYSYNNKKKKLILNFTLTSKNENITKKYKLEFYIKNKSCQSEDYALYFDGINDYIEINDNDNLDFKNQSFSINAWIKLNKLGKKTVLLMKKNDKGVLDNQSNYNFYVQSGSLGTSGNEIALQIGNGIDNNQLIISDLEIKDNNWHYLSVNFDYNNNEIIFYLDNQKDIKTTSLNISSNNSSLYIGKYTGSDGVDDYLFQGQIKRLSIWNKYLTQNQTQNYMNQNLIGNENGLISLYKFNSKNKILYDYTNNNYGQLYNFDKLLYYPFN